jgi:hypothetical protein
LDVLIDNDLGLDIELRIIFARNVKKEIIGVIDFFFFFLTRYDEWKAHNMLSSCKLEWTTFCVTWQSFFASFFVQCVLSQKNYEFYNKGLKYMILK